MPLRPIDRLLEFLDSIGVSQHVFEKETGISNGYIHNQTKRKGNIGSEILDKIHNVYPDLNLYWLITGKGKMVQKESISPTLKQGFSVENEEFQALAHRLKGGSVTENVTPTVTPTAKKQVKTGNYTADKRQNFGGWAAEGAPVYNLGAPKVVTVNERKEENIIYVPIRARAGYLTGYGDPEYIQTLPTLRLPGLDNATYRMFEVDGPSMAPNIMSGDRVIGQWVDNLSEIRDSRVYIVVTHTKGIIVKRLLNRIDQRGKIVVKSDTISHRREFPTIEIDPEEIKELWYARLKLSADFSEPSEVYHRLEELESDMTEVKQILSALTR